MSANHWHTKKVILSLRRISTKSLRGTPNHTTWHKAKMPFLLIFTTIITPFSSFTIMRILTKLSNYSKVVSVGLQMRVF